MKIEEQEENHAKVFYHELQSFSDGWGSLNDAIFSFFEDYAYILNGETSIFSENSVDLLKSFRTELLNYLDNSKIAKIGSLKLLDDKYIEIIDNTLSKLANSAYTDLIKRGIEVRVISLNIQPLSNEYIVRVVETLI